MSLYKYYSPDSVDFILVDSGVSVRFSQPEILNDPFEVKPNDSHGFLENPIEELKSLVSEMNNNLSTPEDIKNILLDVDDSIKKQKNIHQKINDRVGIFSLSKRESSRAMWSYYSNDHSGFVVEFKDAITLEKAFKASVVHKEVAYEIIRNKFKDASIEDLIENQIFFKDKDWDHEEEYRFFLDLNDLPSKGYDSMGFAIHNHILDSSSIKRVILGYRATETLRRKVLLWSKKVASNVAIGQSTLSTNSYELQYIPLHDHPSEQEVLLFPSEFAE